MSKTYSYWWDKCPSNFKMPSQLPRYADIVIIGAGFAGINTAFWLARFAKSSKKPISICILDEGPFPAYKSSGRALGNIYLGSRDTPVHAVAKHGLDKARKLYQYSATNNKLLRQLAEKMSGHACNIEFNGGFKMTTANKKAIEDLEKSKELLINWGFYPVVFDANDSQYAIITPTIKSSLYIPNEGMFNPFAFCNILIQQLQKVGVSVYYNSRVVDVNESDRGPQVVIDNGHRIGADKVIHANCHTAPIVEQFIEPVREHVVKTCAFDEALADMPLPLMPIELINGTDSVRIDERGVMMSGGKTGLTKDPELYNLNDTDVNARVLDHLDRSLLMHFPFTNHLEISHVWTYIKNRTKDGFPLVGALPGSKSQFVNCAYGDNPFGLGYLASKNLVERMLKSRVQNGEFNLFNPDRITRGE